MKIIDKTPLLDEKGNLGVVQRIQGMFQFGFNWPRELEVQKAIIAFFDRQLEKGYTLIRNMPLGASGIVIPMILLGPAGIFVISVSYLKGRYEAKGEAWNVDSGRGYKPAPENLIQTTRRMARALTVFIERQGVKVPTEIEPVLIAGDPGLHIESNRPAIRVMMIDGIKSFVTGLATARPVLSAESVFEMTERILNPRPPKKETPESSAPTVPPAARPAPGESQPKQEVSRARAIFNASEQARPFSPEDFDFAMTDDASFLPELPGSAPISPAGAAKPAGSAKPKARRILGMTMLQIAVIMALALCLIAIVTGGVIYYFLYLA
ncbi:MAG: NERD domain-containing protein [Chloroflexi bacterium]|nr:NERD domain-containing protein [Chloroflexota bacterium]